MSDPSSAAGAPERAEPTPIAKFAADLTEILWWLLGERDDLPPPPPDGRKYWWRKELRQRFEDASRTYLDALMAAPRPAPQAETWPTDTDKIHLRNVLCWVSQVFNGWRGWEEWSKFDEEVAQAVVGIQRDLEQAIPRPSPAPREEPQIIAAFVQRVNARAEADMLAGNPITGAHHRAIEYELSLLGSAGAAPPVPQIDPKS